MVVDYVAEATMPLGKTKRPSRSLTEYDRDIQYDSCNRKYCVVRSNFVEGKFVAGLKSNSQPETWNRASNQESRRMNSADEGVCWLSRQQYSMKRIVGLYRGVDCRVYRGMLVWLGL